MLCVSLWGEGGGGNVIKNGRPFWRRKIHFKNSAKWHYFASPKDFHTNLLHALTSSYEFFYLEKKRNPQLLWLNLNPWFSSAFDFILQQVWICLHVEGRIGKDQQVVGQRENTKATLGIMGKRENTRANLGVVAKRENTRATLGVSHALHHKVYVFNIIKISQ